MSTDMTLEPDPSAGWQVTVPTVDGPATIVLTLHEADALSDGRLDDSERTARATVTYLLQRQSAWDLPELMDLDDVEAAYEGSIEAIVGLLEG